LVRFLSKKVTKPKFFFKKTETGSNRPVSVRFGFLKKKPVQTGLARFFRFGLVLARFFSVWLGFFGLARFWLGFFGLAWFWLGFFRFGSVFSVWLGFFGLAWFWLGLDRFFSGFFRFGSVFPVPGLKNRNRTEPVGFFKILIGLIGFFLRFGFFGYFFLVFSV